MASSNTSTQPAKEGTGLDFPGRAVYIRTTNEDVQAPGHQARVENWIHDFEKNRQIFVFPGRYIRAFAGSILGLGLAALILQVICVFFLVSSFKLINVSLNRLHHLRCAMLSYPVFSVRASGLELSAWQLELWVWRQPTERALHCIT